MFVLLIDVTLVQCSCVTFNMGGPTEKAFHLSNQPFKPYSAPKGNHIRCVGCWTSLQKDLDRPILTLLA